MNNLPLKEAAGPFPPALTQVPPGESAWLVFSPKAALLRLTGEGLPSSYSRDRNYWYDHGWHWRWSKHTGEDSRGANSR